jgi:uncharacterized membrane protein YccC
MTWKTERDLLIAQTMAFVQSVSGKASKTQDPAELLVRPNAVVASPREVLSPAPPSPSKQSDLREEIQRRVAAFRARQQLFDRDRDAYFNATLARARAINEQTAKASDRHPVRR